MVAASLVAVVAGGSAAVGAFALRDGSGRVVARLRLRPGRHAETKFVIELAAPAGAGIGGGVDAGGSHATFVDRESDCRLGFTFDTASVVVTQRGDCGLPPGASLAGRYRRLASPAP